MADVRVTLPDGSIRVVDDTQLRLPPAQEPPTGSYVRVAQTGTDEMWFSTGANQWAATDAPTVVQPWSFVVARDLNSQPVTVYRGDRRTLQTLAAAVLFDALRVTTVLNNKVRCRRSGAVVEIAFNATVDTMTPAAATALGLGLIKAGMG